MRHRSSRYPTKQETVSTMPESNPQRIRALPQYPSMSPFSLPPGTKSNPATCSHHHPPKHWDEWKLRGAAES
ncbi:hypothetical protein B0T18DRAFT_400338 [Schizothecium vesticola]|uniref:Uncharacterized protein n=1 Tax=Schizothecium vesticola TaxID=314040 RepID=A0AA40FC76_9PEZI|nr:hypothetical protein B0T18DRAFT_400338 [Schizothecium vesticola]